VLEIKRISKLVAVQDSYTCLSFGIIQALIAKETPISVTRVAWSPDGNFIGVAFTKHLIQLYAFSGPNDLRQHTEIDAHVGAVNDLAFANPNRQLCVITCGDDKLIKVWDVSGRKHFTFEGHDAPVYSICPHYKENIQVRQGLNQTIFYINYYTVLPIRLKNNKVDDTFHIVLSCL
jgi:WD40 repeat protein